jgi:hypothetical protein
MLLWWCGVAGLPTSMCATCGWADQPGPEQVGLPQVGIDWGGPGLALGQLGLLGHLCNEQ